MYGTLYLIPCPISDETAPWDVLPAANRAVMDSLDYFIVENTRTARRRSAGVISEAGVPGVADPGALVVEACHRRGIRVVPLVGPSSIVMAVMASGLNGQSFAFNGYLPVKPPERVQAIRRFERRAHAEGQSQLFIEAPYRNVKLMEQLLQTLAPETRLTVAMDITAPGEFIRTLRVREWRAAELPAMNKRPAIFIIG